MLDLDGTLYRQRPVRLIMGYHTVSHALTNRYGLRDLLVIKHYLNVSPEECLVVGDHIDLDAPCAAAVEVPFLLCSAKHFFTLQLASMHTR